MGLIEGQEIKFGEHVLVIRARRNGCIYAHCRETCCSDPDIRVAIKMPEKMFIELVDHLNYKQAYRGMSETIRGIAKSVHGPSQELEDDGSDPLHHWEKQSLAMED
jgi:hypothetical protein